MFRPWFLLLLCALMLTGCAPVATPSDAVVVWTGMTDQELAALTKVGAAFTAQTHIPVSIQKVPFDQLRVKYQIAAPADLGPDVITGPQDWIGLLATANLIAPLSDADFPVADRPNFVPTALQAVTFDHGVYGFPYSMEAVAMIYNKNLMPSAPATFPALLDEAQELTYGDQYGLLFEIDNLYNVWPFFSGFGATLFAPATGDGPPTVGLDSAAAVQAARFVRDVNSRKLMFPGVTETFALNLFAKGKVACILDGPWALGAFRGKFPYGVAPIPPLGPGETPRPLVGVYSLMLNGRSHHHDQTAQFLRFVVESRNLLQLTNASGRAPTRQDSLASLADQPDIVAFAQSAANGQPMPNIPAVNAVWEPLNNALKLILQGQDVETTLKQAVEQANDDVRQMME